MSGNVAVLRIEDLVSDLSRLRRAGFPAARHLTLPALGGVAERVVDEPNLPLAAKIESALTSAISNLDQGEYGDAALALFGLAEGMRAWSSADRRERAAQQLERSADTFQRRYEGNLLADIADKLLALCAAETMRGAREDLERRHPAESRLAVQWVQRFEAYYRMWTPAWALGADLTAYRSTMLETDRPYDREPGTFGPGDPGYTQERQAEGYATDALYRWAWFQWHLRQFMLEHGGMWLLSTTEAETRAADLVYEIEWHVTVFNERDQSWLRNAVSQSRAQELDHFHAMLESTATGSARLGEWLEWCQGCHCTWENAAETENDSHFPTNDSARGVAASCQPHKVVSACQAYCTLIEEEWLKIADWYHLGSRYAPGARPTALYRDWRGGQPTGSPPHSDGGVSGTGLM